MKQTPGYAPWLWSAAIVAELAAYKPMKPPPFYGPHLQPARARIQMVTPLKGQVTNQTRMPPMDGGPGGYLVYMYVLVLCCFAILILCSIGKLNLQCFVVVILMSRNEDSDSRL
jgi:hypothetical protein